jgi:hypothetical protein
LATDDIAGAPSRVAGGRASRPDPFSELVGTDDGADDVAVEPTPATPRRDAASEPEPAGRRRARRQAAPPLRARQVQRILRYIGPWSTLKVSFLFYLCLWLILLVAGVILWAGASSTGVIDNVESFIEELFGLERFAFEGGQMFRGIFFGGFALVVVGTAFNVLIAVLFNLISDLTGGLRLTVVEVERAPVERTASRSD